MAIISIQENLDKNIEKLGTYANRVYPTLLSTFLTKKVYNQKVPEHLEQMLSVLNQINTLVYMEFPTETAPEVESGT